MEAITTIDAATRARIARRVGMTMVQDGYRPLLDKKYKLMAYLMNTTSFYAIGAGTRITLAKDKAHGSP